MSPRRMTADDNPVDRHTSGSQPAQAIFQTRRRIFQLGWKSEIRSQPVATQDGWESLAGEEMPDKPKQIWIPGIPAAAVQEKNRRTPPGGGILWHVKDQVLLRVASISNLFLVQIRYRQAVGHESIENGQQLQPIFDCP